MGLESKLSSAIPLANKAIDSARSYIGGTKEKIFKDLRDRYLKDYFVNLSDNERQKREGMLEKYVADSVTKYDSELNGIKRKATAKSSMALAFLNDVYTLVSEAPMLNHSALSYVLFGLKTLAEIPSMYRYVKKSHDWYGALKWTVMKPIDYAIPFVGPAIESGLFDRIVKKRVSYEAKRKFVEALGGETQKEKATKALKRPIGEILNPVPVNAYAPVYAHPPIYATA